MSDRELLELAAKAAGHGDVWSLDEHPDVTYIGPRYDGGTVRYRVWNPLTDDGDALRLAVVCRLTVCTDGDATVWRNHDPDGVFVTQSVRECGDKHAAARRAITRAAAEIGKGMK
jgi:hypothetical protein